MSPAGNLSLRYVGPPDMQNDELGGLLVPGEVYEAPDATVRDELLAHPAGWFEQATAKTGAKE